MGIGLNMTDKKKIREKIGYTHGRRANDPQQWFSIANGFHRAAGLLHEFRERIPSDTRPFVLNAALSIELILKAVLAKKGLSIPDDGNGHNLNLLCIRARVGLSDNQEATLELLTEELVWAGRYPVPKTEARWDRYQDQILERHIVRRSVGNVHSVMANRKTFSDWGNYAKIWDACVAEFESASPLT
jgi:hypothetical protein